MSEDASPPAIPRRALAIIAAAIPFHLALALGTDLSPDEAYYLSAARHTGFLRGIPDHPPLTLWLLRVGDTLPLPLELRVRLSAVLFSAATAVACVELARRSGAGPRACLLTATVSAWALLPTAGGFLATPDAPALLAIALAFLLSAGELTRRRAALAGLALALGALAKVVVLPLALLLALFAGREPSRPASVTARLLVAFATLPVFPLLLPSLTFQLHHAFRQTASTGWSLLGALGALLAAAGAQALLWSPPLLWFAWRGLPRLASPHRAVVAGLTALVAASALLRALPPEPNWWAPAALLAIVAAALATDSAPRARRAILLSVLLPTAVAAAHAGFRVLPLPPSADPTARLHGWSTGAEPTSAPGVGPYGPAAERCAYQESCEEIVNYFKALNDHE